MHDFEPSKDFVNRVMNDIRAYEFNTDRAAERVRPIFLTKPVFSLISAGGILLGVLNLIRMALILISPAPCL